MIEKYNNKRASDEIVYVACKIGSIIYSLQPYKVKNHDSIFHQKIMHKGLSSYYGEIDIKIKLVPGLA